MVSKKVNPTAKIIIDPVVLFGHTYRTLGGAMKRLEKEQDRIMEYTAMLSDTITGESRIYLEKILPKHIRQVAKAKKAIGAIPVKNYVYTLNDFKGFM